MPRNENLEIHVHRNGGGHKPGTFTGPAPKMKVDVGDSMQWTLRVEPPDGTATYEVRFPSFWPFAGNPGPIAGTPGAPAPALPALYAGLYHYAVRVTTVDGVYTIQDCPEADVGG